MLNLAGISLIHPQKHTIVVKWHSWVAHVACVKVISYLKYQLLRGFNHPSTVLWVNIYFPKLNCRLKLCRGTYISKVVTKNRFIILISLGQALYFTLSGIIFVKFKESCRVLQTALSGNILLKFRKSKGFFFQT